MKKERTRERRRSITSATAQTDAMDTLRMTAMVTMRWGTAGQGVERRRLTPPSSRGRTRRAMRTLETTIGGMVQGRIYAREAGSGDRTMTMGGMTTPQTRTCLIRTRRQRASL